ncbi:MAG TPA: TetR/AcrR family transcriptional regulator [Casimicrobiaceae bacterium]|nr:TetR/AcrR family transcriptional regulator [Casimicrobiaceae bacterium]
MPERKRPRRTRERILEASLALFNAHGEPNVTTAHVADEMNISPGNLYYHFRNKGEIVEELYDRLESQLAPLFVVPGTRDANVEDLWLLLHLFFEQAWSYRFFYRDLVDIASRHARIGGRFAALTRNAESAVITTCGGMISAGAMHASDNEVAALARNVVIVATYWMSFERTSLAPRAPPDGMRLNLAAYQVLSLVAPYTIGETRDLIADLGERYL